MAESMREIGSLGADHQQSFSRALANVLSTEIAELTFAQILDGLPTEESLRHGYHMIDSHPVIEMAHTEICDGYVEKARQFRAQFDPSTLRFKDSLLYAFEATSVGSKEFKLRLVELVVIACHQIAAYLYELDEGAHKHSLFDEWLRNELLEHPNGRTEDNVVYPPAIFFHRAFTYSHLYPRGPADVAGYWAEGRIFGGVVVFERGETERECNEMWIHGSFVWGPRTLYPPLPEQFDALIDFLLAPSVEGIKPPFPIHASLSNRPRWHPWHALAKYHIFRDKFERELSLEPPATHHERKNTMDWPEANDHGIVLLQNYTRQQGQPVDEEAVAAAWARLAEVTPSSPFWDPHYTNNRYKERK